VNHDICLAGSNQSGFDWHKWMKSQLFEQAFLKEEKKFIVVVSCLELSSFWTY
jgi:hypothetical protein